MSLSLSLFRYPPRAPAAAARIQMELYKQELDEVHAMHARVEHRHGAWEARLAGTHDDALDSIVEMWRRSVAMSASAGSGGAGSTKQFFVTHDGQEYGPYDRRILQQWVDDGKIEAGADPPAREFGGVQRLSDVVIIRPAQQGKT